MLTQGNAIQTRLEELARAAESRNAELKQRLQELSSQPSVLTEVKFRDTVTLHVGTSKFDRVIRSTAKIDDLAGTVTAATGHPCTHVGYRDDQGRLVWLRTSQDVKFMFATYFADKVAFRQITVIAPEEVNALAGFALRKEHVHKEGMPVFRVDCAGPNEPLIFLTIPAASTREQALEHFAGIFGPIASLRFHDPADDGIAIDSEDAWEYCLETAVAMSRAGKYLLLVIETSGAD
jgi:hypothetical protein